ncbi:FAD-dependent oxidoreductase [Virgibacillus ndiopensis]|uniref:FAD-dependent oxidoreductase n=1 Tax=Virgibacillus ndiopensis TaxID=2004408 RepID=UPI000C07C5CA|nr:FAD-dependent oxidoreductase [Virgibacillus ndiopensis]
MSENSRMPQFPEPFWRDYVSLPSFPKLEDSISVDVGIVGGGITGITAAYLLAKENVKVAVLDAGVILNGTTGHTTAKITAQHGLIYDELMQHFGIEKTSLYYDACKEAKQLIEHLVEKHDIDCEYKKEDAYIFTDAKAYISQLETEKKAYEKLKIDSELVDDIPLDVSTKSALIMKNQAQFHPLKYLKVLVEQCVENGVQFYEQTTAVDVEYNKHPSIITRDGKRVTCRYVIQASHYPFYDGQGFYPTRMYPERSYIIAVKSDKKFPGGMYINAEKPTRSVRGARIKGEDLWLIVGENHKTGQGKSTMKHYEALQKYADQHFGINEFAYRWSAQDLTTLDKVPYIGPVTKAQQSVFVATGFRKWGMTNGTIAAKHITDMILDNDTPYQDLYSPARFQADPAIKKFTTTNADVAKHLIKGKLEYTENNIDKLTPDDATVTRINGKRTGVYKDKDNNLHALDTTCQHLGCEVHWNSGDRTWDCPCHGSRYSYTGEVIEGPAKRPLNKVDIE